MADEPAKPAKRGAARAANPAKAVAAPARPAVKRAPATKAAQATKAAAKPAPVTKAPATATPARKAPAKAAPASKALAKAAPAKAAPARKAPARKAPTKRPASARPRAAATPVAPPPSRGPAADVIGDADERHPGDPVTPLAPRPPGLVDELVDGLFGDAAVHARSPLLVRIVRGGWLPSLAAAIPAVLVAVAAVVVSTVPMLFADRPGGDEPLFDDLSFGRWLRSVFAGVGMAFGAPYSSVARAGDSSQAHIVTVVPLTVTAVTLLVLWIAVRRSARADDDLLAGALRTATAFAAGIGAVAAFGRWTVENTRIQEFFGESREAVTTNSVAPLKAMFWAFVTALAVAYLARRPLDLPLAVRGAIAGVGAGIVASFVALVGLAYAYAGRVDATVGDVTTLLPVALGYAVDLGTAGFSLAMGGSVRWPFNDTVAVSLWEPYVPGGYAVALLIPVLAVAAGVGYIVRYGNATPADAARACGQMAIPAALLWWLLAIVGSVSYQLDIFFVVGSLRAGATLWSALLVFLWFGVLGWLAGRLLLRREPAFDPPEAAPVP